MEIKGKGKGKSKGKDKGNNRNAHVAKVEIRRIQNARILVEANATSVIIASSITPLSIVQISLKGNVDEEARVCGGAPFKKAKQMRLRQHRRQGLTRRARLQAMRSTTRGRELERRKLSGAGANGRSVC